MEADADADADADTDTDTGQWAQIPLPNIIKASNFAHNDGIQATILHHAGFSYTQINQDGALST